MIWRVMVYAGIASVFLRGIWLGWDWMEDWLTDWWAWAGALVVFAGLETVKQIRRRA